MDRVFESVEVLAKLRAGDEAAAEQVFERYMARLTALARTRLSPRIASRVDPEDIVLSAWRSFFVGARCGRFTLRRSGELWQLLVAITMHKLYRQVRRHTAQKRAVEMTSQADLAAVEERLAEIRSPAPEEVVAVSEEVESLMSQLTPFGRRVLELRLQSEPMSSIAADTCRTERTVRRELAKIRELLSNRLGVLRNE